ncbi:phytoene desaturase family protein [Sulfodiicoccus acidiphilus]|uniref:phytoene desaturase family protein n=1 Tax=Sulfodiicoccus acidiphilus TaxID=1670455 RepID=UPI0013150DF2|nr:NAD(P)/FAD-dependent oxidoreductase [Sulfodiicoccus acidiphilus]
MKYDAVVIGAGHNGLVAACYLAKAGLKVAVVERRSVPGGAAVTEELWPGYKVSRLSYSYSLFSPKIVEDLKLKESGLEVVESDVELFVPFEDGRYLTIWSDPRKTVKEISNFSVKDAEAYLKFEAYWRKVGSALNDLMLSPPPDLTQLVTLSDAISDPIRAVKQLGSLLDMSKAVRAFASHFDNPREAVEVTRTLMFASVHDFLSEYFETEEVKAAFVPRGLIGTMVGPRTPGSAYVLAHHMMGESTGRASSWGYLKGGMGGLSWALTKRARSLGAQVYLGVEVEEILVSDGKVRGVRLGDGRTFEASVVLSNASPKHTIKLIGRDKVDQDYVRAVDRLKDQGCVLKFNAAISELPDYKALPGKGVGPQHRGITSIGPSEDYAERAFDDAKYGRFSREPVLRVVHHSVHDPTMAPPGKHTISIFALYFPYDLKEGDWDSLRDQAADAVIDALSNFAPNFRGSLLQRDVLTPLDLEREFMLPKGNIFHAEITPDQMFSFRPVIGWSSYRTPINGLYLCGSATHPGGGVTGAPGHNAAFTVLRDLGLTR